MIIKTSTTISFNIPDECEQMEAFMSQNNMGEFVKDESTQWISFTKTTLCVNEKDFCYIL